MSAETRPEGRRLLAVALRLPAVLFAVGCAAVFLVLAVRYHGSSSAGRFDTWAASRLLPLGHPDSALARATDLTPLVFLVLDAVAAAVLLVRRRWRSTAFAVAGPGLTVLVAEVGKPLIGRTRLGELSLPSGHAAVVTAVALVAALLLVRRVRAHELLAAAVGFLATTVVSAAMAILLVILGWHFATDTVAGYCVGSATTLGVALALDAAAGRRASPPPRTTTAPMADLAERPG